MSKNDRLCVALLPVTIPLAAVGFVVGFVFFMCAAGFVVAARVCKWMGE